jgi:hypothetical protein
VIITSIPGSYVMVEGLVNVEDDPQGVSEQKEADHPE